MQVRRQPQESTQETRQDPALMGMGAHSGQQQQPAQEESDNVRPLERRTRRMDEIDPNDESTWGRVPRNAPCPCGSGKKFKQCHGKL